jgi:hypothetical protein
MSEHELVELKLTLLSQIEHTIYNYNLDLLTLNTIELLHNTIIG